IREAGAFRAVNHNDDGAKAAIRCLAWTGRQDSDDLRLVFGGDDGVVHFRNYTDWNRPDSEKGIGHQQEILSVAWSLDGQMLVTGTTAGTIGVWEVSELDNQLRGVLSWTGIRAHND